LIKTRIAKRYARALFELAEEEGKVDQIGSDIKALADFFAANDDIRTGLTAPVTSPEVKAKALDAILEAAGVEKMVTNFLKVLLEARKFAVLPLVAEEYSRMADEATGRVRGEAIAPIALSDEALKKLSAALSKALDKEVVLVASEDKSLLGGVVARVGNLYFDASAKTQLERMKDSLTKG